MTRDNRDNILRKLRAILDKAESSDFSEERDAFLRKADELMVKFAVEEHELVMSGESKEVPEVRSFDVCRSSTTLKDELTDLLTAITHHARGRVVYYGLREAAKYDMPIRAKVVAFPSDLDYIEMLFTSLQLQLASELEPKPDPEASIYENMAKLKESGATWKRAFQVLGIRDPKDDGPYKGPEHTLIAKWRTWADENGRSDLRHVHPKSYRRSYAQGFVSEVRTRFADLESAQRERDIRDGQAERSTSLVLRDRSRVVDEAYAEAFPNVKTLTRQSGKFNPAGYTRGREAGARADLSRTSSRIGQRKGLDRG